MEYYPIKNYLVVESFDDTSRSAGGLYLPEIKSKKDLRIGKVFRYGPDIRDVREGDLVLYDPTTSFVIGTKLLIDWDSVLAIAKKGEDNVI